MRQGLLPNYVQIAFIIASSAGAIAGLAKTAWQNDAPKDLSLDRIRSIRARMNTAFDHLERIASRSAPPASAIQPERAAAATENFERHGNFGMLALAILNDSASLAIPLMKIADGSRSFHEAKPEIEFSSADVRVTLHVISEQARISAETSTSTKWRLTRESFPEEAFQPLRNTISAADAAAGAAALMKEI